MASGHVLDLHEKGIGQSQDVVLDVSPAASLVAYAQVHSPGRQVKADVPGEILVYQRSQHLVIWGTVSSVDTTYKARKGRIHDNRNPHVERVAGRIRSFDSKP